MTCAWQSGQSQELKGYKGINSRLDFSWNYAGKEIDQDGKNKAEQDEQDDLVNKSQPVDHHLLSQHGRKADPITEQNDNARQSRQPAYYGLGLVEHEIIDEQEINQRREDREKDHNQQKGITAEALERVLFRPGFPKREQ